MTVRTVIRTEAGSVTVSEEANGIGSPVLVLAASENPAPKMSAPEVQELRDVCDDWLRERGRA